MGEVWLCGFGWWFGGRVFGDWGGEDEMWEAGFMERGVVGGGSVSIGLRR